MPIKFADIPIDQFADFSGIATWLAGGVPPDFTGATARMQAKILKSDPTPVFGLTTTPSGQGSLTLVSGTPASDSANAVPSQILVTITKAATALVVTGLLYDLFIDWPDGTSTDFLSGKVYPHLSAAR